MANLKITELSADTAPTSDDLIVTVNDPGGSPANRKVTIANLFANNKLSALASTNSAELAGVISDETGSGVLVFGTQPVFTTDITVPIVYGSSAANGDLTLEGTSSATKTTSYVILQPTGGNVGIGTTVPEETLHVFSAPADGSANARIQGTSATGYGGLTVFNNTGNGVYITIGSASYPGTDYAKASWFTIRGTNNIGLRFSANSRSDDMVISTSGNVGIGTATPAGKQHTVLSSTAPALFGGDTIASLTGVTISNANPSVLTKDATIDDGVAVGNMVIVTGGTNATTGVYRVASIIANTSVTLDRQAATGACTDGTITYVKDIVAMQIADSNGIGIRAFGGTTDTPLQLGGTVNAATGHSLTSPDVLVGGKLEVNGAAYFDSDIELSQTQAAGALAGTLANSVAVGDPAIWLKIKVGASYYAVPGWLIP